MSSVDLSLCGVPFDRRPTSTQNWPERNSWSGMVWRCHSRRPHKDYGGRGIKVCDRWRHSFDAFLADMGPRPSAVHSVDRYPNPDGDYEPGNTRWATPAQQNGNKRNNRLLSLCGRTMLMSQWEEASVVGAGGLVGRLAQGLPLDVALTLLPRDKYHHGIGRCRVVASESDGQWHVALDGTADVLSVNGPSLVEAIGALVMMHHDTMGIEIQPARKAA